MAQEATRLADLGMSAAEIAKRLDINRSTVTRWMKAGRIADTRHPEPGRVAVASGRSADEWGKAVRSAYALDDTDEELVRMGEAALGAAHSQDESMSVRLAAMGRFQAIVKQLALVTRNEAAAPKPEVPPTPPAPREFRRPAVDPRHVLKAVR